jgi:hypothetical protein
MTDKAISPLRQRMIEDLTIRKLAPKTQHDYVQRVKNFAAFLGRLPDTARSVARLVCSERTDQPHDEHPFYCPGLIRHHSGVLRCCKPSRLMF